VAGALGLSVTPRSVPNVLPAEPSATAVGENHSADRAPLLQRNGQLAFTVFVVAQALIFIGLVANFHSRWFLTDEWDFLANRTAGNLSSLFRPHNEHWSTLPILYYRLLWTVFGIRTYVPYLASVVGMHIAIGFALRRIMVRSLVMPWIATITALAFSLYGAGYSDISYPFNIGFDGSVLFGLLFIVAVDHDGRVGQRDLLGVLAGLAALMCSSIGVAMVAAAFIAISIRNGVRRALVLVTPLAGIYLVWFMTVGHRGVAGHASLAEVARFAAFGLAFTFSSLGSSAVVGLLLTVLLVGGVTLSLRSTEWPVVRSRYSAPYALLVGAVLFMIVTGVGRANAALPSALTYAASRYIYVAAAMFMPALAVAASMITRTWPKTWPVVVLVIVIGVPGNIAVFHRNSYPHALDGYRELFLSLPRLTIATHIPRSTLADPLYDPYVTMGWLLDGVRSGRIPPPSTPPTQGDAAYWTLQLAVRPTSPTTGTGCQLVSLPSNARIEPGSRVTIDAPVKVSARYGSTRWSRSVVLGSFGHPATYEFLWSFDLRIRPSTLRQTATVCRPAK